MTTVVNTPASANDSSGNGWTAIVVTILILGTLLFVFYTYFLPMIRNSQKQGSQPMTIKVEMPVTQPPAAPATQP